MQQSIDELMEEIKRLREENGMLLRERETIRGRPTSGLYGSLRSGEGKAWPESSWGSGESSGGENVDVQRAKEITAEVELALSKGATVLKACEKVGINATTYYRARAISRSAAIGHKLENGKATHGGEASRVETSRIEHLQSALRDSQNDRQRLVAKMEGLKLRILRLEERLLAEVLKADISKTEDDNLTEVERLRKTVVEYLLSHE